MNELTDDRQAEGIWKRCTNSAVRRAARQLGQLYDNVLAGTGMRSTQFALLSQIALTGTPSQKSLAEALVMDLSALGHTLKPLERDGFVEFVADEQDKRVRRVRLTPKGKAKQEELVEKWRDAQQRFDRIFGAEKSAEIREVLAFVSSPEFARAFSRGESVADKTEK